MSNKKKKYDDLTEIKGIGLQRQEWLEESFGVCTFRGLAALTVDEIESRSKTEGGGIGRKAIAAWILEAKALAEASSLEPERETNNVEAGGSVSKPVDEEKWNSFASFQVNFLTRQPADSGEEHQTMVHCSENNRFEKWSGIQIDRLSDWIQNQLKDQIEEAVEEKPAKVTPSPDLLSSKNLQPQKLDVNYVRVFQPAQAGTPVGFAPAGKPFPGMLEADQSFTLQAGFELDKLAADKAAGNKDQYKAEFYVRNWSTGTKHRLGNTKPKKFIAGKVSYDTILPNVQLDPGEYSLRVLVTSQSKTPTMGILELPLLRVL